MTDTSDDDASSCSFCRERDAKNTQTSLCYWSEREFLALPSLGCFVEGYSLLVPNEHVTSFAELELDRLRSASEALSEVRTIVEEVYGPCLVAEHGTGVDSVSAACSDHAHLHIIPIGRFSKDIHEAYISKGGSPKSLRSLEELAALKGSSYIMTSYEHDRYQVWQNASSFYRQFARFTTAAALGVSHSADWRQAPCYNNMIRTYALLKKSQETPHITDQGSIS